MKSAIHAMVAVCITAVAAQSQVKDDFPYRKNGQYLSQRVLNRHFPSVGGKYRGYKFGASMTSLNRKRDSIITYSYQYRGPKPAEKGVSFWITDFGAAQDSAAQQREFSYHLYRPKAPVIAIAGRSARTHEWEGKKRAIGLWANPRLFVEITSGTDSRSQDTSRVLSLDELTQFAESLPYDEWDVERTPASLLVLAPEPAPVVQTGAPMPGPQPATVEAPPVRAQPTQRTLPATPAPAAPTIHPPEYVADAGLDTAAARTLLGAAPEGMSLKLYTARAKRRNPGVIENAKVEFIATDGGKRSVRIIVTDLGRMSDAWVNQQYFTTGSGSTVNKKFIQGQPATTNSIFTKQIDVYVANRFAVRINGGGGVKMDELLVLAEQLRFELLTEAAGTPSAK